MTHPVTPHRAHWAEKYWTPENLCALCHHPRDSHLGQPDVKGGHPRDDSGWCTLPMGTCIFSPCEMGCKQFIEPEGVDVTALEMEEQARERRREEKRRDFEFRGWLIVSIAGHLISTRAMPDSNATHLASAANEIVKACLAEAKAPQEPGGSGLFQVDDGHFHSLPAEGKRGSICKHTVQSWERISDQLMFCGDCNGYIVHMPNGCWEVVSGPQEAG